MKKNSISKEQLILEELKFNLRQIHHNENAMMGFVKLFGILPIVSLYFIFQFKDNPLILISMSILGIFITYLFKRSSENLISFKEFTLQESRKLEDTMDYFKPISKYTRYKNKRKSKQIINLTISNILSVVLPSLNFLFWIIVVLYSLLKILNYLF